MLEQRERGEPLDPTFEEFKERFGDMFPGADTLDELLEQLAARMAAAEAMWRSLSPEQRDQLRALADSLLEDMDLRWQVDRLSSNLQRAFPDAGWGQAYSFSGDAPLGPLRGHRHGGPAGGARPDGGRPAVGLLAGRPLGDRPRRGRAATWATTRRARSSGWPAWPAS